MVRFEPPRTIFVQTILPVENKMSQGIQRTIFHKHSNCFENSIVCEMYYFHLIGHLAFVEGSELSPPCISCPEARWVQRDGSVSALLPGWSQEPLSLHVICASWPWLPLSRSPFLGCPMNANSWPPFPSGWVQCPETFGTETASKIDLSPVPIP